MQTLFPWLILLLPLAAAALISLFTRPHRDLSARLSIGAIVAGFWLTLLLFALPGAAAQAYETRIPWLAAGGLQIDFGLRIDRLSLLMALVVTAVGGAIHIYSYEYMRGERRFSTYFACLSLFTFAMLGVVFAPNFVLTVGGPDNATMVPSYLTYYHFFTTQRVGYAAAIATVQMILTMGLAVIFLRFQARQSEAGV